MKIHGIWGWAFVCRSVSFSMVRLAIVTNAFSRDLKTHKSQFFPMIAPRGIAKLRTSCKVTIFPPPVPHYFISDILKFCERKILQSLEYCFPNSYFRKFLFLPNIL